MAKQTKASKPPVAPPLKGAPTEPVDQAERKRIEHELDTNILVEASAGTGKTTSLVARMINLIRTGRCSVDGLAAVTFTRKAAAELRARFQLGLENAAHQASGVEHQRLALAVAQLERAFLGTIHSFCARLLRERPVEAGVNAEFTELDDAEDEDLRRRSWLEYVARLVAANDPILDELDRVGMEVGQLGATFEEIAGYPDVDEWPAPEAAAPDPAPVAHALMAYIDRIEALLTTLPDDPGNDKLMPQYRRLVRAARQADLTRLGELFDLLQPFLTKKPPDVIQKNWPGGKDQAKNEQAAWDQFAQSHAIPFARSLCMVRYTVAINAVLPALETYNRIRRHAGVLNFQDLLLTAARLLRTSASIRKYFRKRFTHLLIDEFQDTDPIQAEVMLLLTADDPDESDWRRCRPVKGSLFVVGDPKQSIYRFRRADIVTYNEVKTIIERNGGRVVTLTANFRTAAPLVDWINDVSGQWFPAQATEVAPRHSPLEVGRRDAGSGDLAGLYQVRAIGSNKTELLEYEPGLVARHDSPRARSAAARSAIGARTGYRAAA